MEKVVLLTGGSSGIGAATARILAGKGMKVYAGSRRGTIEGVSASTIIPVKLDVNDEELTHKVVADIVKKEGKLDAVICNAGMGIYGPVEGTTDEEVRLQFETNYFGALKTIRACLPVFRSQGSGRIITVSSVMGVLQLPFQGFYSSAKAALLSISQSLSMELAGSGIECCCILPGDVATGFTSARRFTGSAKDASLPYGKDMERNLRKIEADERGGMAPEAIGMAIARQLERKHMKVRVIPGFSYKAVGFVVRVLPEIFKLKLLRVLYT